MSKKRVVIFGNQLLALDLVTYLLKAKQYEIVGIVCHARDYDKGENPWYPSLKKFALQKKLLVFAPAKLASKSFLQKMEKLQPDIIITASYRKIIPLKIINLAKRSAFNVHGSLLPRHRGWAPLNWAIIRGEKVSGSTAHFLSGKVDEGNIIAQAKFKITKKDDAAIVINKMRKTDLLVAKKALKFLENENFKGYKQNERETTYNPRRQPADGHINWSQSSEDIYNFVRALVKPFPGAFSFYDRKKVFIWKVKSVPFSKGVFVPGTIITARGSPIVATADGAVKIIDFDFDKKVNFIIGRRFK